MPNKFIIYDDKDLAWMNENMKSRTKFFYKKYTQNEQMKSDLIVINNLIAELNELILCTKTLYFENLGKKFDNTIPQVKMFKSVLNNFYNYKKFY